MSNEEQTPVSAKPTSETKLEVDKVSVKLPPFWVEKPEIWFCQAEAQFIIAGITTEATKFNYLLAQLEPRFVENIWDLVTSAEANKYSLAKDRLLTLFKESEERQIKKLVSELELGDMKPSQLLRKMKGYGGTNVSDKILKTLWLDKLPSNIRSILSISDENVEKMAQMADRMFEMRAVDEVQTTPAKPVPTTSTLSFQELLLRIEELEREVSRSRSHSRHRSRNRSKSRPKFDKNGKYCYYHFRFGNRCKPEKCVPPCQWKNQEN